MESFVVGRGPSSRVGAFIRGCHFAHPAFAVAILAAFGIALWISGLIHALLPCVMDCGETFVALQQVAQYERYGFAYSLLQDHATSANLAAHPYIYTHNVSLPALLFPLLRSLGISAQWVFHLAALGASLAGLTYIYKSVAHYSRSRAVACLALLLFATDYIHVFSFGLNALRAWHWLALFGIVYHTGRLLDPDCTTPWAQRLFLGLFACISFAIGYDFWIICGFTGGILVLLQLPRKGWPRRLVGEYAWFALIFAVPLLARQFHIGLVLGWDFLWKDLTLTAAIKVPFLKSYIDLPPLEEVDQLYRNFNILRAPASPAQNWGSILVTAQDMFWAILVPSYGAASLTAFALLLALSLYFGLGITFVGWIGRPIARICARWKPGILAPSLGHSSASPGHSGLRGGAVMLLGITVGAGLGMAVFAPLSLHIYFKHQFPLVAAPLLIAKAFAIALSIALFARALPARRRIRWLWLGAAVFLLTDHALLQAKQLRPSHPMSTGWTGAVAARADASFVVSWISDAVDAFASGWSAGLPPGFERDIAERIASGKPPFQIGDYFLFGQRDAAARRGDYERPDYWLYFPTDHMTTFDSVSPVCSSDLWIGSLKRLVRSTPRPPSRIFVWTRKSTDIPPGGHIIVGGQFVGVDSAAVARIVVEDPARNRSIEANYNCIYSTFAALVQVSPDEQREKIPLHVSAVYKDGRTFPLSDVEITVDRAGQQYEARDLMPWAQQRQPSPKELAAMLPGVPVAEMGRDFVLFDLRGLYKPSP